MRGKNAATGLAAESFNNLLQFLNPGEDGCSFKFHNTSSRLSQRCDDICWLKALKSIITRYLITWTNFSYFSRGAVPI